MVTVTKKLFFFIPCAARGPKGQYTYIRKVKCKYIVYIMLLSLYLKFVGILFNIIVDASLVVGCKCCRRMQVLS